MENTDPDKAIKIAQNSGAYYFGLFTLSGKQVIPWNSTKNNSEIFFNRLRKFLDEDLLAPGRYEIRGRFSHGHKAEPLCFPFVIGSVSENMRPDAVAQYDPETQGQLIEVHKKLSEAEIQKAFAENRAESWEDYARELEERIAELERENRGNEQLSDDNSSGAVWQTLAVAALPKLVDHIGPKLGALIENLIPGENEPTDSNDPGVERSQPDEGSGQPGTKGADVDQTQGFYNYDGHGEN